MNCNTLSKLALERYFTEELSDEQSKHFEHHIKECQKCREWYTDLRCERESFLEFYPYQKLRSAVTEKKKQTAFGLSLWPKKLLPVVVTLGVIIMIPVFLTKMNSTEHPNSDMVTLKGKPTIDFLYRRNGEIREGDKHTDYLENDEIQIVYSGGMYQFITLISIDGRGNLSFHQTNGAQCGIPVKKGNRVPYPFSITLDDAPKGEMFIALFSERKLNRNAIVKWVKSGFSESGTKITELETWVAKNPFSKNVSTAHLFLKKGRQ